MNRQLFQQEIYLLEHNFRNEFIFIDVGEKIKVPQNQYNKNPFLPKAKMFLFSSLFTLTSYLKKKLPGGELFLISVF